VDARVNFAGYTAIRDPNYQIKTSNPFEDQQRDYEQTIQPESGKASDITRELLKNVEYSANLVSVASKAGARGQIASIEKYSQPVQVPIQDRKLAYFLGKHILITGASSGIGRTLAFFYLNNGARVALVGRDVVELDSIARQFPA
jgi:FlaA1/EpsC-like NDP-sugar epimerase